jgi:hypothetical protein
MVLNQLGEYKPTINAHGVIKKTHVSQKQPHDSSDSNPIESHDSSDENIKNKEKMPSFIL